MAPAGNAVVVNEYVRCYVTRQDGVEGAVRQAAPSPKLKGPLQQEGTKERGALLAGMCCRPKQKEIQHLDAQLPGQDQRLGHRDIPRHNPPCGQQTAGERLHKYGHGDHKTD